MRLFRNYSAFVLVVAAGLIVSGTNLVQGKEGGSRLLAGYFGVSAAPLTSHPTLRQAAQASNKGNLSLVPLANAPTGIDPTQKNDSTVVEGTYLSPETQMFLSAASSTSGGGDIARDPEENGGVKIYTVQPGDTVSGIAARNNITVNTILWANDLDNVDSIKPGDQIFILPVAGFNYVVKNGDTIDSIASKYKADKDRIIAFNGLPANGELTVGDQIVIPDGQKDTGSQGTPSTTGPGLQRRQYASESGGTATDIAPDTSRPVEGRAGSGHSFPYGYCTWYVAQKRFVPWGGNAGTWLFNARAMGYKTGKVPTPGSIVVTTENRFYGHVAIVEKVTATTITVSEMNYVGWGKRDMRQMSRSSGYIKGYIY